MSEVDAAIKRASQEPGGAVTDRPFRRDARETPSDGDSDGGTDRLIDFHQLAGYGRFAAGALRRRKLLAIGTFMLVAGATAAAVVVWPRTYHVDATLLAQKNSLMSALSNPGRAIPPDADSPTRAAAEIILRRDNLVAMVAKTDLLRQWDRTRAPILKLKDRVYGAIWGGRTEDEKREALIGLLQRRLVVSVGSEETVTIGIDWPDRQLAFEFVRLSVQNFLEARRIGETSAITESASILERSVEALERQVEVTYAEVQADQRSRSWAERLRFASRQAAIVAPAPVVLPTARPAVAPEETPELRRLRTTLASKREALAKLEESRRQELSEAQAQLASSLAVYTESHPSVIGVRQRLKSLAVEPPQLPGLRTEVRNLDEQYESAASAAAAAATTTAGEGARPPTEAVQTVAAVSARPVPPARPAPAADPSGPGEVERDETANPLVMRLKAELTQLGDFRARLEGARIELATSEAAFKYRYNVLNPPLLPRAPIKPNAAAVLFAGLLGAFVLALVVPVSAEILTAPPAAPSSPERWLAAPAATGWPNPAPRPAAGAAAAAGGPPPRPAGAVGAPRSAAGPAASGGAVFPPMPPKPPSPAGSSRH